MPKHNNEEKDIEQEAIISYVNKDNLVSTVANSIGVVELKRGEKRKYLGQFRERILKVLTAGQLNERWVYPDIVEAIKDTRSSKVIIKGEYRKSAKKYAEYAKKYNKQVLITNNPEYTGDIALIVVADDAVDLDNIEAGEKTAIYKERGLPEEIIKAGSGKLCSKHYQQLIDVIDHEPLTFSRLSFFDRLMGEECSACVIKEAN